jgi:hypothetical protein
MCKATDSLNASSHTVTMPQNDQVALLTRNRDLYHVKAKANARSFKNDTTTAKIDDTLIHH